MKCKKCQKETEAGAFATYRNKNGELRRRGVCRECRGQYALENFERLQKWRKEYNQENRNKKQLRDAKRKAEAKRFIDELKSQTPCADCGLKFHPVAMDFDHVGPKTKGIANFISGGYRLDLIEEEIKKCELVCACCHRVRTHNRKQNLNPGKQF